jgi:valyl-tRNA synthetase
MKVPMEVFAHDETTRALVEQNRGAVERLANVETIAYVDSSLAKKAGSRSTARFDVHVIFERKIDIEAECARLTKELQGYEKEIQSKESQLSNEQFRSKAPANIVENMQKRLDELRVLRDKTLSQMAELGCDPNMALSVK